jgi:hypothetical protein
LTFVIELVFVIDRFVKPFGFFYKFSGFIFELISILLEFSLGFEEELLELLLPFELFKLDYLLSIELEVPT